MSDERETNDAEFSEAQIQRLRDHAKALPSEIPPDPALWANIRDRIESARVREFPNATSVHASDTDSTPNARSAAQDVRVVRSFSNFRGTRFVFLAAASLFIAVTTVVVMRERREPSLAARIPSTASTSVPAADSDPVVDVSSRQNSVDTTVRVAPRRLDPPVVAVLVQFNAAALDLTRDLDARRPRLQPDALAVIDSCLHTIDRAIQESRAALSEDPNNTTIVDLLQVTYRQKLDLLRRASDLPMGLLPE